MFVIANKRKTIRT